MIQMLPPFDFNSLYYFQYGNEYRPVNGIFETLSSVQGWNGKCHGKKIVILID